MSRRLMLLLLASTLGCASERTARPVQLEPSHPEAPQAPAPPLPQALTEEGGRLPPAPDSPQEGGGHGHLQHGASTEAEGARDAGATVYTCPMHPEVRQPQPGRCPRCGMELVPAKPQAGGAHGQGAHGNHPSHGGPADGGQR